MGGFIVFPRRADESLEEIETRFDRSLEVFRKKNLKLDRRLVRDGFVAYRYCKLSSQDDEAVEFDNGDFAFYTGTFIYRGMTGKEALRQVYEDIQVGKPAEEKIAGNFHLLICRNGELWSLGDYCGYYPVYIHDATRVISNSYLAVGRLDASHRLNRQVFFEYVFHGFFVNEETLLKDVRILDSRRFWHLGSTPVGEVRRPAYDPLPENPSLSRLVEEISSRLNAYFESLVRLFPHDIGSALSGGFDSRHMLALLTNAGASPYLYVYGSASSSDVVVAKDIARGKGLSLEHIDKGLSPKATIGGFRELIERNTYFFDGIKPVGLIDDGSDLETRFARARHARLQLNGAGGEIYREIWNISDRNTDLLEFLKMRFDQGSYDYCHGDFSATEYFLGFAEKVRGILGIKGDTLTRSQAEMLFPFLRNKFAQSNNSANSQISNSLLPFMETIFIFPSFNIPIKYKYSGELHCALIRAADASLAKFDSSYGINFFDPIPGQYRFKRMIERHLPLWLRLKKREHASRKPQPMPYFLTRPYLETIVDLKSMEASAFVDISKITNPEILSRVLSVDLLLKQL